MTLMVVAMSPRPVMLVPMERAELKATLAAWVKGIAG
jgi:hypothetical protein